MKSQLFSDSKSFQRHKMDSPPCWQVDQVQAYVSAATGKT